MSPAHQNPAQAQFSLPAAFPVQHWLREVEEFKTLNICTLISCHISRQHCKWVKRLTGPKV